MTLVPADAPTVSDSDVPWSTRFSAVRGLTEALADPLSPEDQVVQSMDDVSPTKWHRAHTTWFFETFILEPGLDGYEVFDPMFGYLFNSYYEAVGVRHPRPKRGLISRPSVNDIAMYRNY
ncbi:MAG: L-histidine N(alpha)-methyltransferase, partial [Acidimicrobiia bacterium]|nr:L-histidine N(alpha)-methyltransferase [Acidimicrobiia bacterium]